VLDRKRILAKLDELDSHLNELREIAPKSYEEYKESIEKRRACERLLHISIECVIGVCNVLVANMRLGLPAEEEDLFRKLQDAKVISRDLADMLRRMRAFRNILVHRYGTVDDKLVYDVIENRLGDFKKFKRGILRRVGA